MIRKTKQELFYILIMTLFYTLLVSISFAFLIILIVLYIKTLKTNRDLKNQESNYKSSVEKSDKLLHF